MLAKKQNPCIKYVSIWMETKSCVWHVTFFNQNFRKCPWEVKCKHKHKHTHKKKYKIKTLNLKLKTKSLYPK
jgi:hypothetical protein